MMVMHYTCLLTSVSVPSYPMAESILAFPGWLLIGCQFTLSWHNLLPRYSKWAELFIFSIKVKYYWIFYAIFFSNVVLFLKKRAIFIHTLFFRTSKRLRNKAMTNSIDFLLTSLSLGDVMFKSVEKFCCNQFKF